MSKYDAELETDTKTFSGKILKQIKYNSTILEFGSASGRFTKYLKENMNCQIHIVEINKEDFNKAMQYASDGICSDIETMEWKEYFKDNKYDHIIFTDVLEHLREPQKVFNACADFIKDDGSLLFSIPNAAHGDIIANLYNNDFKYTELGLLDNTHIHLFAYKNILDMVEKSQLKLTKLDAVYRPLADTEQYATYTTDLLYKIINEKKYADVYQFIGECKKNGKLEDNSINNDYVTVYMSSDGIFTEEKKINFKLKRYNNRYEIIIENLEKNIKQLRVDPIENKYVIIDNVQTIGCSNIVSHNGIEYKGKIIFNTLDPLFVVNIVNNKKITISFEMQIYNFNNILEFYNKLDSVYILINEELQNKNKECIVEIDRQYNIIENFNSTISELIKHNNLQHERMVQQDKEITEMSTTINELNKHNNLQHERMVQQEEEINKLYDSINKLKIKENEQNNIILGKEMENNVLNQQINENMKILDELKNKLDNTEKLLYKIENSKSWKITKPLRIIARKFKHGREI